MISYKRVILFNNRTLVFKSQEFAAVMSMLSCASSSSSLIFKVERKKPEMIQPAEHTPYEFKFLSDIDDQKTFRKQDPIIQFYPQAPNMKGRDPVKIIREAIAKTLVFYYPFAGRLLEGANEKLVVECTGEGVIFIEANAYVKLDQFGHYPRPPFPCVDELIYSVPGTSGILHSPLLLIQVTRLLCGGFIFAIRLNHAVSDATGIAQFMTALGEIARGASAPSVQPVWKRELLNARNPPRVTRVHHAYDQLQPNEAKASSPPPEMAHRSFFFGPRDIASLRSRVPAHLQKSSRFELLTACLWKCRTVALNINPDEEVRLAFNANARAKFNPPLPAGYYGNAVGKPVAMSTASELCKNPLEYAVELIKRAKNDVTEEFMKSTADLLVMNGRFRITSVRTFAVSDLTQIPFMDIDFGWGKAVYGGPPWGGTPSIFFIASKSESGEDGILVTMDLPEAAMARFASEVKKMTKAPGETSRPFILSNA